MGGYGKPEEPVSLCGEHVGLLRARKGLKPRDLIYRLLSELDEDDPLYDSVSEPWLKRLEAGQIVKLPRSTILAIGRALQCTTTEMVDLLLTADRNVFADEKGRTTDIDKVFVRFTALLKEDPKAVREVETALSSTTVTKLAEESLLRLFKRILDAIVLER